MAEHDLNTSRINKLFEKFILSADLFFMFLIISNLYIHWNTNKEAVMGFTWAGFYCFTTICLRRNWIK